MCPKRNCVFLFLREELYVVYLQSYTVKLPCSNEISVVSQILTLIISGRESLRDNRHECQNKEVLRTTLKDNLVLLRRYTNYETFRDENLRDLNDRMETLLCSNCNKYFYAIDVR